MKLVATKGNWKLASPGNHAAYRRETEKKSIINVATGVIVDEAS